MPISVVTITREAGQAILATAASIAAQTLPIRWIVIDGASTDGTPERLRSLQRPPDILLSEADHGIADAFNKGLDQAGDDDVHFLNAGDRFAAPDSLERLATSWRRDDHRWIVGGVRVTAADGRELGVRMPAPDRPARDLVMRGNRIPHPAVLAEAAFLRGLGGFDPAYRLAMDYELWLRAIAGGHAPQVVEQVITVFALGGASGNVRARLREDRRARRQHALSAGWIMETWLAIGGWARLLATPCRHSAWAYRLSARLRW